MRRFVVFFAMLLMIATIPRCAARPKLSVKNEINVLLITIDSLRADHLRCYGYAQPISPKIDALANRGVQFNRCISQCSMTPASHASILTGQNPYRHGVRTITGGEPYKLDSDHFTLAALLKTAGYQTAAFVSAITLEKRKFGLDNGFDHYDQGFYEKGSEDFDQEKQEIDSRRKQNPVQRRADLTTLLAIDWLRKARSEPFFLWVHYFDPHETFLIPPIIPGVFTYTYEAPLTDVHSQLYDIEIRFVDLMIGNLISNLFKLGLGENTLIVLTSDHGQGLGNHDYNYHGQKLYQEQVHVPLIFTGKSIPVSMKQDSLVRSVDIVPTVLDILGYPDRHIPSDIDGVSLRGLWESRANATPRSVAAYSETSSPKVRYNRSPLFSIVRNDLKLIYHAEAQDESELYDLAQDPFELNNIFHQRLAHSKELIEIIRLLQEGTTVDLKHLNKDRGQDWEAMLKSLGYLN